MTITREVLPQPVGYQALVERFELKLLPHFRQSYVTLRGQGHVSITDGIERHVYPKSYMPEDTLTGHLEFALKYDGVNLEILKAVFKRCSLAELEGYIRSQPTSKYVRKIWFLYEYLMDDQLAIADVGRGNYIALLDPAIYITANSIKSKRHRVNNNLLGSHEFSPMVRHTGVINDFIDKKLGDHVKDVVSMYPEEVVARASQFLYLKETKSSFEIEREQPNQARANRFVGVLQNAGRNTALNKQTLIELQNIIVDERFIEKDYRKIQNYVGQVLKGYREKVHYISPKQNDVPSLMAGLLESSARMKGSNVDPIVQAAVAAFGFVFIHPFEDGNGRLHRFIIHQILTESGFTPENIIFPVSAVMLAEKREYDACLERYSNSVMPLIEYDLDGDGELTVKNETDDYYRYFDATGMVEYLYSVVEKTIDEDFVEELKFIVAYSEAKVAIPSVVDMPDKMIDLFIKLCLDNKGKLSNSKRKRFFEMLSDDEVIKVEQCIKEIFRY